MAGQRRTNSNVCFGVPAPILSAWRRYRTATGGARVDGVCYWLKIACNSLRPSLVGQIFDMNLSTLLRDSAAAAPERLALRYGVTRPEHELTYAELDRAADRVAGALAARGVATSDRVAIAMGNGARFVSSYFGILRAGAAAVPLNAMLTRPEIRSILEDSGAVALLGAGQVGEIAAEAARDTGVDLVLLDTQIDELPPASFKDVATSDDDLAVLGYTSGTTGAPRGAMLTHGNLLANLRQQMAMPESGFSQRDVLLLALPLWHIFGLNVTLGLLVLNGATGVLLERFEPIPALQAIRDEGVSVVFGAPPMFVSWVSTPGADQYDVSSLRLAVSGAAPLTGDTLQRFKDLFGIPIYEGYGLTETAPTLTSNRMSAQPTPGSIGKPLPEVELRIVDEELNDVELGDPGEIVVRGPNVFKGYWNRPEDTERAFSDGWFRTGDIAVRDEDGHIYLVDRKRDLIIVSGFNVFPSEVETALLEHPAVAEVAVVGAPHQYSGEAVKAFVVLEPGSDATEEELLSDVRGRLARFKCPSSIAFVDRLPHLLTGKVLRRALRD